MVGRTTTPGSPALTAGAMEGTRSYVDGHRLASSLSRARPSGIPRSVEASPLRCGDARDSTEVRPRVPGGGGPDCQGDSEADRAGRPGCGDPRGKAGQQGEADHVERGEIEGLGV